MSNFGPSPAAPIGGREPTAVNTCLASTRWRVPTNSGSPSGHCNHPLSRSSQAFCATWLQIWKAKLVGWGLCAHHVVWCCHVISPTLLKTSFCVHGFFFYSFTASDGSEGTTAGRVVSLRSMMVHHGCRSIEAKRALLTKYL